MNQDEHTIRLLKDTYFRMGQKDAQEKIRALLAADLRRLAIKVGQYHGYGVTTSAIVDELSAMVGAMERK